MVMSQTPVEWYQDLHREQPLFVDCIHIPSKIQVSYQYRDPYKCTFQSDIINNT